MYTIERRNTKKRKRNIIEQDVEDSEATEDSPPAKKMKIQ